MDSLKNEKGQVLIIISLAVGALMVVLIYTMMSSLQIMDKEVSDLKVRIDSYQAVLQFSQALQQGFRTGNATLGSCTNPSGPLVKYVVPGSGVTLCLPASLCTSNNRYCLEQSPNYSITKNVFSSFPESDEYAKVSPPTDISITLLPQAQAQSMSKAWLPSLTTVPNVTIGIPVCDASTNAKCTICKPAANATADCFKIKVCTNRSTACPDKPNYFEAVVAINFQKN